jgi:hypothetical protein
MNTVESVVKNELCAPFERPHANHMAWTLVLLSC